MVGEPARAHALPPARHALHANFGTLTR
eukprot:SAG25_NODE_9770_length_358_cov_1.671815_1_plen_27_part_01